MCIRRYITISILLALSAFSVPGLANQCTNDFDLATFEFVNKEPFDENTILDNQERIRTLINEYSDHLDLRNTEFETIAPEATFEEGVEEPELADKLSFNSVLSDIEANAIEFDPVEFFVPVADAFFVGATVDNIVMTFEDPHATSLDKATALFGWVPLLGTILHHFDSVQKKKIAEAAEESAQKRAEEERRVLRNQTIQDNRRRHAARVRLQSAAIRHSHVPSAAEEKGLIGLLASVVKFRDAYADKFDEHWKQTTGQLLDAYVKYANKQIIDASIAQADFFVQKGYLADLVNNIYSQVSNECEYEDYGCIFKSIQSQLDNSESLIDDLVAEFKPYNIHLVANTRLPIIDTYFKHQKEINEGYLSHFLERLYEEHQKENYGFRVRAAALWYKANNRYPHVNDEDYGFQLGYSLDPACWGKWYIDINGHRVEGDWRGIPHRGVGSDYLCDTLIYDSKNDDFLRTVQNEFSQILYFSRDPNISYITELNYQLFEYGVTGNYFQNDFRNKLLKHPGKVIDISKLRDVNIDIEKTIKARAFNFLIESYLDQRKAAYKPTWSYSAGESTWVSESYGGDIQCFSYDGWSCAWELSSSSNINENTSLLELANPLTCGADHKSKFGSTGYQDENGDNDPQHWCSTVREDYNYKTIWYDGSVIGINTRLSKNSEGDIQCFSSDRAECDWGESQVEDMASWILPAGQKALACGADYQQKHGTTGYQDANGDYDTRSWCYITKIRFSTLVTNKKPNWVNAKPLLGLDYWVSLTPDGDAQCFSSSGRNCLRDTNDLDSQSNRLQPLICGEDHKLKWGVTGYENSYHWCVQVRDNFEQLVEGEEIEKGKQDVVWYKADVINIDDLWLTKNDQGDIQCLSFDGATCYRGEYNGIDINKDTRFLATVEPLSCGEQHQLIYGLTGYESIYHWCYIGQARYSTLVAQKRPIWQDGTSIGVGTFISRTPDGAIQCIGDGYGYGCAWGIRADQVSLGDNEQPLICGEDHKRKHGSTGLQYADGTYNPNHWCSIANENFTGVIENDNNDEDDNSGKDDNSGEGNEIDNSPAYSEGHNYQGGDVVTNNGKRYVCMDGPTSTWCGEAAWAYAPGTGASWQQCWALFSQ